MKKTVIISFFAAALMLAASCGEDTIDPVPQPPVKEEFKMSEASEHVPVMEIMTDRQADIVSKDEYLRARITIKENNKVTLQTFGNARGRGNYTCTRSSEGICHNSPRVVPSPCLPAFRRLDVFRLA